MRKSVVGVCAIVFLAPTGAGVASASTHQSARSVIGNFPSACKKVAFTATAGYYSAGHFYSLPGDTVTVHAQWCYSSDAITSHQVSWTTKIPATEHLRITKRASLNASGSVLTIGLNGDFNSGVINNVGYVGIAGQVTALGHHKFANVSGSGG